MRSICHVASTLHSAMLMMRNRRSSFYYLLRPCLLHDTHMGTWLGECVDYPSDTITRWCIHAYMCKLCSLHNLNFPTIDYMGYDFDFGCVCRPWGRARDMIYREKLIIVERCWCMHVFQLFLIILRQVKSIANS